jgi:hypothetical protein
MITRIKNIIWLNLKNIPGWSTSRKILVIEADDYGSIRMPSTDTCEMLIGHKIINGGIQERTDTLESKEDLENLFEVLKSFEDRKGRCARITPFFIASNPDFEAIERSNFTEYYYKSYWDTLLDYGISCEIEDLWKEGISMGFFKPQYHGREHLNVPVFMRLLREGNMKLHQSFRLRYCHPDLEEYKYCEALRPAFYFDNARDKSDIDKSLEEGIELFISYFKYIPTVFCPSNGVFHDDFKPTLVKKGVKGVVESGLRYTPDGKGGLVTGRKFIFGELDRKNSLINYSRNVVFEPCRDGIGVSVQRALREIDMAYRWNKPAIVSTHRYNYCGGLSVENRNIGMVALKMLLSGVLKKWPEIEFMNSSELINLVKEDCY